MDMIIGHVNDEGRNTSLCCCGHNVQHWIHYAIKHRSEQDKADTDIWRGTRKPTGKTQLTNMHIHTLPTFNMHILMQEWKTTYTSAHQQHNCVTTTSQLISDHISLHNHPVLLAAAEICRWICFRSHTALWVCLITLLNTELIAI